MAFTSIASSTFTQSNGLPTNFTNLDGVVGEIEVISNAYHSQYSAGPSGARWDGAGTFSNDQYSSCVLSGVSGSASGDKVGVIVRASTDTVPNHDFYFANVTDNSPTTVTYGKVVNGTVTNFSLDSTVTTWTNGDVLRLYCVGTTITVQKNGVDILSTTDSALTTGKPGIYAQSGATDTLRGDDWDGGDVTSADLDQTGFRFRNDDGSETGATGIQNEDTDAEIDLDTNFRLRVQIDTAGDVSSTAYVLRYQMNGTGGYAAVPLTTTSDVTPTVESGDCTNSGSNTASTSWAVSHAAAATGDMQLFCIAWDDSTNTTGITAPNGPNGETITTVQAVHTDSGTSVRLYVGYYIATGAWSAGTLTFTPSASEQWTATVAKIPTGEFDAATPIGAKTTSTTNSTGTTHTLGSFSAGGSDGGGRLFAWFAMDTNPITSAPGGGGWTIPANVDRGAVAGALASRDTAVTDSESITGAAFTSGSNATAAHVSFIVRPNVVTNPIYVSASSNIAASGEATTALLTAPSGKTTSDFTTGRMWDDENGTDSIDIAEDFYTEVEWCLKAQSPTVDTDYFDFRVYAGASAIGTYSITPRITITVSGGDESDALAGSALTGSAGTSSPGISIEL